MSHLSDINIESTTVADREHEIQLGLLRALCAAAGENRDAAVVGEILERLIAYSEAHFMSEELLMRLNSYDDYEDHVDDHAYMLDTLRILASRHAAGDSELIAGGAAEALAFIGNHIATRDRRFTDSLRLGH
ncbi:MAG: hemerythrin family protein [Rhodocyclales bacterium]|nr:hemerythrin family protein [Rhodocyclales bacterium]